MLQSSQSTQNFFKDLLANATAEGASLVSEPASQEERQLAAAALFEVEELIAKLPSNSDLDNMARAALAAAKNVAANPSSKSAMSALRSAINELQSHTKEARAKVLDRQEYAAVQAMRIDQEYHLARSIQGFGGIDKEFFSSVSRVFTDMDIMQRAMLTAAMEHDPKLRASVAAANIAGEELRDDKIASGRELRQQLDAFLTQPSCETDIHAQRIAALRNTMRFAAVTPTDLEEALEKTKALNEGKITAEEYARYLEQAMKSQIDSLKEQLSKSMTLQQSHFGMTQDEALALVNQQFGVDVLKLAQEDPAALTTDLRGKARDQLNQALAEFNEGREPPLSFAEFRMKAREPETFASLSEKTRAALIVHTSITLARDSQRVFNMVQTIADTPELAEKLQKNFNNPEIVVAELSNLGLLGTDKNGVAQQVLTDILKTATPEQRKLLIDRLVQGDSDGTQQSFEQLIRDIKDPELLKRFRELDPDAPPDMDVQTPVASATTPQMCSIPPSVQAQINAAGVLNLGRQPTNMSPVEVPSLIPGLPRAPASSINVTHK